MVKHCKHCGDQFERAADDPLGRWEQRKYCSILCRDNHRSQRSHKDRMTRIREGKAGELRGKRLCEFYESRIARQMTWIIDHLADQLQHMDEEEAGMFISDVMPSEYGELLYGSVRRSVLLIQGREQ